VRWTFTENSASAWGRCGKRWVFSNRHNSSCEPGRGTFVRGRETDRAYERFNPIRGNDGGPLRGRIKTGKAKLGTPRAWERAALTLEAGDHVIRFERLRCLEERAFAYELVCLPERRFPDLMSRSPVPDDLEELAHLSGILLARAEGKVRALKQIPIRRDHSRRRRRSSSIPAT